ncbi:MAG: hypothetical protein AVDCRST_MAG05-3196 [uncultured Rubrobacteraceae bacterium]|uniref:Uncharacterized protein n=1 Tax=uncultured Rubrobacteraceae bacterium TaxID=349277 RepID=A0A6J4T603_9ACTN|nr:MAG: hypothetical protein AVDCRST_MAG05-3196 [uncultured Rubrobacteraceae bacterium]
MRALARASRVGGAASPRGGTVGGHVRRIGGRAREGAGTPERTIYRGIERFERDGMLLPYLGALWGP